MKEINVGYNKSILKDIKYNICRNIDNDIWIGVKKNICENDEGEMWGIGEVWDNIKISIMFNSFNTISPLTQQQIKNSIGNLKLL